jgi:hypothetical protein
MKNIVYANLMLVFVCGVCNSGDDLAISACEKGLIPKIIDTYHPLESPRLLPEGSITVEFIIQTSGRISDLKIVNSDWDVPQLRINEVAASITKSFVYPKRESQCRQHFVIRLKY